MPLQCHFSLMIMLAFNLVFENPTIESRILIQPSRYQRPKSNLLADEKVPNRGIQVVVWLYIYIYRFISWTKNIFYFLINPIMWLRMFKKKNSSWNIKFSYWYFYWTTIKYNCLKDFFYEVIFACMRSNQRLNFKFYIS